MTTVQLDKWDRVFDKAMAIQSFMEWLMDRGIHLGEYHTHDPGCLGPDENGVVVPGVPGAVVRLCGMGEGVLYSATPSVQRLINQFFEIDERELERERRALLDSLQTPPGELSNELEKTADG